MTPPLASPADPARAGRCPLAEAERLLACRDLQAADVLFTRAAREGADPDRIDGGRWLLSMLRGDFERAWQHSDRIAARGAPDPHRFWQGEPVAGKRVIVRCLHGFGDAVQMLRFVPLLAAQAAEVYVQVAPRLLPLAPFLRGVTRVIPWGDIAPEPAWDLQVEVMQLPHLLRVQPSILAADTPYLHLPPAVLNAASAAMGDCSSLASANPAPDANDPPRAGSARAHRVGLVWAAGEWNPGRSLASGLLAPLCNLPGVELWSLQGGPAAHDAAALGLIDATSRCGDGLLPLAATIAHLDLVITVDTLAAHLAGALGKPVWLLLEHAADWRWMTDRDDTPWYPTMRLFRQRAALEPTVSETARWAAVVADVHRELVASIA